MTKHFGNCFYFITLLILAAGFLIWSSCQIDFAEKEIESLDFSSYLKFERQQFEIEQFEFEVKKSEVIPGFVNLDVSFLSQAPYAIWDELHNHACEEAAMIMIYYYLTEQELNIETAEQEILSMVDWQIKNWGGHFDLSAKKIVELFENYYGSTLLTTSGYENLEIIYPHTKDLVVGVKKELRKGNPIIVPAAGRLLGNPNFTPPGPLYHILVIKGYDDEKSEFITNDPGTRRGADFRYNYQVLENAIHDLNNGDILNGRKAMIVIK